MKSLPTLYKRAATGKIQQWTITSDGNSYFTDEGVVSGKITRSAPHVCEAKNTGRSNATSTSLQAEREALAEWTKKKKRGYTEDIKAIDSVDFKKPMKGDKWKDRAAEVTYPIIVQDKLNGIRCQNTAQDARSTGGEIFYTIPHIREALKPIFDKWPDAFIDGEAFNYALRQNLNRLIHVVSVVYKPKDLTPELLEESRQVVQLHVFDGFGFDGIRPDMPYLERHAAVKKLIKSLKSPYLNVLECTLVANSDELYTRLKENKKTGGEGLMVRWGNCEYKNGRSKYLLKLKHFEDAEFKIVDVQEGNADWAGCAKRIVLKLPEGVKDKDGNTTFASNIEGDREYLREMFQNKKKVIGKMATVEYQCLSEYNVPQIPWVRAIRDYE